MKKLILILTAVFTVVFSACALAADGDLNKQQDAAQAFINGLGGKAAVYTEVSKGFSAELKGKVGENTYAALQSQVKEKFGDLKESKFYSFQRFDEVDYVTYLAAFSKEKLVNITLAFNKRSKMVDFALTPVEQNAAQK